MRVFVDDEGWVELDDAALIAEGGQGRVYGVGSRAYKIATLPEAVLDPAKLVQLAAIRDPQVVRPLASIRSGPGAPAIGHAMHRVARAIPWMQLVPRAARMRLGLDRDAAIELCARLQSTLQSVHAQGIAIVDLSGGNVLVDPRRRLPYLIDLDSAQAPGFPATAITPQIACPLAAGRYGAASDWFAFAVLSFELLMGIHPYRGTHPRVVGIEARMAAGISVLDPSVRVPPVCEDPSALPPALRSWFETTFAGRHRGPAPLGAGPTTRRPAVSSADCLANSDGAAIRGVLVDTHAWWWTDGHVGRGCLDRDGAIVGATPTDAIGLVRVPGTDAIAMLCQADDGALALHDPINATRIDLRFKASTVRVDGGAIVVRCGDRVGVLELRAPAGVPWASFRALGRTHPAGSTLWPGCATSRQLGRLRVQTIDLAGSASRDLPELGRARVVDAAACDGIVALLVADGHRFDRWVIGVRPPFGQLRVVERDVDPLGCAVLRGPGGTPWVRLAAGLAPIGLEGVGSARVEVGTASVLGVAVGAVRVAHGAAWCVPLSGSTTQSNRQTRRSAC